MEQQEQTLKYFSSVAEEWQKQAADETGVYNMLQDRSRAVLDIIKANPGTKRFLDVGCGSGQLVIDVAKLGIPAEGNDFADEMIDQCLQNKIKENVDASFFGGSFFDVDLEDNAYDIISAQGFIEYLSPEQMMEFFKRSFLLLRQGGSLIVGSRNRLFNIFSLNEYTKFEMKLKTIHNLLAESIALQMSRTQEEAFQSLETYEQIYPQVESHPETGIGVDTRYQYSPSDLICRLRSIGFKPKSILPVNYHGFPISIKNTNPELHSDAASIVMRIGGNDCRFVPQSSTFVLQVQRPA